MKTEKLEQSYKDQLVKAGVNFHRAEQAAKSLTWEQLQFVSDIWPEWAAILSRSENEIAAARRAEEAQGMRLECTLGVTKYKVYEVFQNEQPLGVIAWHRDSDRSVGAWYTVASDGAPQYFQTQEAVIDFLRLNCPQAIATPLGGYLVEAGLLTQEQINIALAEQALTGRRFSEVLVELGWVKQQTIEYLMEKG